MNDVASVCACLADFEERAAALYRKLAGRFSENMKLCWFWVEMSLCEKQHAGFLQFCAAEEIITGELPGKQAIRSLSKALDRLERKADRPVLSIDDAFLIAAELEKSEINAIYSRLIGPVHGSLYVLRKKIETTTLGHIQALTRAARKFDASPSTIAKLSELERQEVFKASAR